jgi:murein tripeptide amidase MpaA
MKGEERMPTTRIVLMSVVVLWCAALLNAQEPEEKILALGKYDFYHYYEYDEMTNFMKDMHDAYPNLTELTSLSKTQMGRDVWMLMINNPETGEPQEKPGFFINQIHAGEVIAAASNCYTIWYLLDNFGKDEEVTGLVNDNVWYIVPRLDMDGAEAYLTQKPAGKDPNPVDDDLDFEFDEDPPEDVDGDGHIVQMRQKDPDGEWKISKLDPRMMIRKGPDETDGAYYKMYSEGLDNDGDEKINEDSFSRGFLSNRNYPGNWRPDSVQRGGRKYPMQEGVTKAEVEFVADHPNIALYVQSHCCGRVILRPPTTAVDREFAHRDDLRLYQVAAARSLELSGWDLATSVFEWRYPPGTPDRKRTQVYRDKDGKLKNMPTGMSPEEEEEEPGFAFSGEYNEYLSDRGYYAWGSSLETMYNVFGIFAWADEHWAHPDYNKNGRISEKERLRWNDEEMKGSMFIDWHPFDHPTLGEVEIGGWIRVKGSPPEGELVQKESKMGNAYKMYLASLPAKLEIKSEIKATNKEAGIFQLDITIKNNGFLRTALQHAQSLNVVEPIILEVTPDSNLEILFGEEKVRLDHINGYSESGKTSYVLRKKNSTTRAVLKATVKAQRANNDAKEIVIP